MLLENWKTKNKKMAYPECQHVVAMAMSNVVEKHLTHQSFLEG